MEDKSSPSAEDIELSRIVNDIYLLNERVDKGLEAHDRIINRDRTSSNVTNGAIFIITIFTLAVGAYQAISFNEYRIRAEDAIAKISGFAIPSKAFVYGLDGAEDKNILMQASMWPREANGFKFFEVRVEGVLQVGVDGNPGNLLGYNMTSSGEISRFQARGISGEYSNLTLKLAEVGAISLEKTDGTGLTIGNKSPVSVTIQRQGTFFTCREAELAIKALVEAPDQGDIGIIPIFTEIKEPPSKPFVFDVAIERAVTPSCKQWADMTEWRYE